MGTDEDLDVRHLLNAQTGRLGWAELQRHFARGVVIRVSGDLDLVEAAARLVEDDKRAIQDWMETGWLAKATLEDARRWEAGQAEFWAVVAAPWVLVQESADAAQPRTDH